MSRLVIVSNRVGQPITQEARAGGLEVALRDSLYHHGGGVWFGWSGEIAEPSSGKIKIIRSNHVMYATIDLTKAEYHDYYVGFANSTLWPLFHYCLEYIQYQERNFEGYINVNRYLAGKLRPFLSDQDTIWVHDYHLLPFARELRSIGVKNRIGFFLHTPFPPPEVLAVLPHNRQILESLCAYDLVGFQTEENVNSFLACIAQIGGKIDGNVFSVAGRTSKALAFPISIDTQNFVRVASSASESPEGMRLRKSMADRNLIIGVDRLDYSKGLPNRFAAIDRLLARYPEHRGRFTYLQITPYSRSEVAEYRKLRHKLESAAGRINGKYADFDWLPIRYLNQSFNQQTLAAFYRYARIGFVTPLRDGMNLVAKEYVAAQDIDDPGVLVLSRFAGSARELGTALLVNPFNIDEIAEALHIALEMSPIERRHRWQPMMTTLLEHDITKWREDFLKELLA